MTWRKTSFQHLDIFSKLGVRDGDSYVVNKNCLHVLEEILKNLVNEDCSLRTYRRSIGFGEHMLKDLIPLLIHVKTNQHIQEPLTIIDTTIKILQHLTLPIEGLLSLEQESRTEIGRHIIFELNCLLITSKEAFTDTRSIKVIADFLKYMIENESKFDVQRNESINNCFELFRNILHIPEMTNTNNIQNQIIWNLFTQSIDKIMIQLMSSPAKVEYSVSIVQLIALLYKNQSVTNLQTLLGFWFEASLSESSEDNESNTSPQNQGSGDSSMVLTSDPTSDSSDNGGSRNGNKSTKNKNNSACTRAMELVMSIQNHGSGDSMVLTSDPTSDSSDNSGSRNENKSIKNKTSNVCTRATEMVTSIQNRDKSIKRGTSFESDISTNGLASHSSDSGICSKTDTSQSHSTSHKGDKKSNETKRDALKSTKKCLAKKLKNNFSDCGYATHVENERESISTSSNDDERPYKKPVHQKPTPKNRCNQKNSKIPPADKKEMRRKKLVKRGKTSIINMKGLMNHVPTDEDISDVLKEFTVDFLLKSYGTLAQSLYAEFVSNINLPIDVCHFFWLVTYFLKFAVQLELDIDLISPLLSHNVISYLVFQGVWQLEELQVSQKFANANLKPNLRRNHMVVTAIQEVLKTIEMYKNMLHLSKEDHEHLQTLELQICEMNELGYLILLLLREYNPDIQSKQYLQDLIVTNHAYLLLLEKNANTDNLKSNILEYLKEFATVEMMGQYGILLEDFHENGKFVNNCIFTMLHHIGGDLEHISTLFQSNVLRTFSNIWETDYDLCDVCQSLRAKEMSERDCKDWSDLIEFVIHSFVNISKSHQFEQNVDPVHSTSTSVINYGTPDVASQVSIENEWSHDIDEYINNTDNRNHIHNTISNVIKNYDKTTLNTDQSEIKKILENIAVETIMPECLNTNSVDELLPIFDHQNSIDDDIEVLKNHLMQEQKGHLLKWLQNLLLEACYAKRAIENCVGNFTRSIAFYYSVPNLSIPLIPWTTDQCNGVKHQPFVLLLNKLGFILPRDTAAFIRIPNFWSSYYLLTIAEQLEPINGDKSFLKP